MRISTLESLRRLTHSNSLCERRQNSNDSRRGCEQNDSRVDEGPEPCDEDQIKQMHGKNEPDIEATERGVHRLDASVCRDVYIGRKTALY